MVGKRKHLTCRVAGAQVWSGSIIMHGIYNQKMALIQEYIHCQMLGFAVMLYPIRNLKTRLFTRWQKGKAAPVPKCFSCLPSISSLSFSKPVQPRSATRRHVMRVAASFFLTAAVRNTPAASYHGSLSMISTSRNALKHPNHSNSRSVSSACVMMLSLNCSLVSPDNLLNVAQDCPSMLLDAQLICSDVNVARLGKTSDMNILNMTPRQPQACKQG